MRGGVECEGVREWSVSDCLVVREVLCENVWGMNVNEKLVAVVQSESDLVNSPRHQSHQDQTD